MRQCKAFTRFAVYLKICGSLIGQRKEIFDLVSSTDNQTYYYHSLSNLARSQFISLSEAGIKTRAHDICMLGWYLKNILNSIQLYEALHSFFQKRQIDIVVNFQLREGQKSTKINSLAFVSQSKFLKFEYQLTNFQTK